MIDDLEPTPVFEKERDDIMIKRYQLEEFKKEMAELGAKIAQMNQPAARAAE